MTVGTCGGRKKTDVWKVKEGNEHGERVFSERDPVCGLGVSFAFHNQWRRSRMQESERDSGGTPGGRVSQHTPEHTLPRTSSSAASNDRGCELRADALRSLKGCVPVGTAHGSTVEPLVARPTARISGAMIRCRSTCRHGWLLESSETTYLSGCSAGSVPPGDRDVRCPAFVWPQSDRTFRRCRRIP